MFGVMKDIDVGGGVVVIFDKCIWNWKGLFVEFYCGMYVFVRIFCFGYVLVWKIVLFCI